tara:strand:- start:2285 stop:2908 length:624 start_codon:yes stop_codon:yes gene_type:complete
MELMVGNWEDDELQGFYVEEYNNLSEAQCSAFQLPDIDWYKLVRMNVDHYHQLNKIVGSLLKKYNFFANKETHLMRPEELKEVTFNRVLNFGERYTTTYNMNDIITINIIDPWSKNLVRIANMLEKEPNLRIFNRKVYWDKIIILTGETELGLTYEIKLFPTILWRWAKWTNWYGFTNKNENQKAIEQQRLKAIELQNQVDKGISIR